MQIGIIGIGRMGLAMAKRLSSQGVDVFGWDVDAARGEALATVGARGCETPAEVVARSETILSIVTDDAAVRWLFEDPAGLLAAPAPDKLFIEMTTAQPATIRRIAPAVEHAGGRLVGAPVLGSIPTVAEGKLFFLAGGAEADVARARTVLAHLARDVAHLGPLGAGNAMKLIVNLSMAAYLQTLAEGLALGVEEGLALPQMLDVLAQAPTANPWLAAKREVLLGGPANVTLDLAALRKDVLNAVTAGSVDGVVMPMAAGILSALSAAIANGHGGEDLGVHPKFFRERMVRRPAQTPT
jgi:3-hydroxyisobutyrate dehydrogenase-like beta-hydroxyacid dehydrogenase